MPTPTAPITPPATVDAEPGMAARVAAMDWSDTPLGPMDRWPQSLRTAVGICLNSRFPMYVWWGPDLVNIYNDAYAPMLGQRHPAALGRPARSIWGEIWDVIGPQVDAVMRRGEPSWHERVLLRLERNGYAEEAYFTWSQSPIPDDAGGIGGLFCAVTENTEQVRTEQERDRLATSRQLALDSARMGWWHLDPATGIASWDARYAEIFGVSGDRVDNAQILARLHPDDLPHVLEAVRRALDPADPRPYSVEYRVSRDDGTERWVEAHGVASFEGEGARRRAVSFVGTVADVTDRRAAAERLRLGEERLAFSLEAGELGTFYCPMPMGQIVWNDKCKEHFWLPPDAAIDFDLFYAILHPDDRDRTRRAVEQAIFSRQPYDIEYRTVAPDGRQRWVRAKGRAYYDATGSPARFDGITLDVTEQKRQEVDLRESERRFREMADTAPAMLWITDPDGRCTFLSRGWYAFTGQTEAAALGYGWANAAHPDDFAVARDAFVEASRARREYAVDFRLRRADGVYRWVIDAGRPRYGPGGAFLGFIGSVIDINDRKLAEAALGEVAAERERLLDAERAARGEAERQGRMKDEFLATLSHELRTPLNAILGWAQILVRGSRDDEDLAEGLRTIERNARAQTQIIEDLLDMSRIISGKVRLDVRRIDLAAVVAAAVDTVRPAADAKGIRIQSVLDPRAGPASGDPGRLQQVFWNLLSNAVKFTPRDGRVQVLLRRVDSHLEVDVADTGEGIAPEFLPHVFERFRQADASSTRKHGGLGLGLAIVKHLVELHGGTVAARSGGPGAGATFTVTLPLAILPEPPASPESAVRQHPQEDGQPSVPADHVFLRLDGVRVLIVDDEPDARAMLRRLLEEAEATVAVAASADEAEQMVRASRPDVLISDIGMPGEDGYALIRRVRALGPAAGGNVPAIALTAYARADDRVRAIVAGFQHHVAKPVEPVELIAMVASLAGRTGQGT